MLAINIISILLMISLPTISLGRGTGSQYASAPMEKNCGTTILLNGDNKPGTYFTLSSGKYGQNLDCILTIKAATSSQRIIIVIDKMDVACGGDKLIIYDGKKDQASILNKNDAQQCGTSKYYIRTAVSNMATIEFISNNDGKVGTGFLLNVAINFPVGNCPRTDNLYRCQNNYCISNLFNCDDRNWCGDNTQSKVCS